jgi:hypothetical protein
MLFDYGIVPMIDSIGSPFAFHKVAKNIFLTFLSSLNIDVGFPEILGYCLKSGFAATTHYLLGERSKRRGSV